MTPLVTPKRPNAARRWLSFKNSSTIGYVAVLLASACWATSGIFVKYIADGSHISPLALAFWRDLFTFIVLLTGVRLLQPARLRVHRRDLGWLFALGASIGVFHVFWNLGIVLNGAAVTTVQQAAMPAIVAVVAYMLWQEPLTWRKIMAILLTFTGTVLVSGLGDLNQAELTLTGVVVGFGLPISYASWSLFGKKIRRHYDAITVLTYAFGAGALVLLPFLFFTRQPWPMLTTTGVWFAALIGISTITAFASYTFALGRLPASVASILAMVEIAFVVVFAYFLLGESLAVGQIIGTTMVVGGVILLFRRKANKSTPIS
jgi:drug/metabolite transporter (DMT)-like permease